MYKRGSAWCMKVRRPDGRTTTVTLGRDIPKTEARKIEIHIQAEINLGKFFDIRKGEYLTVSGLLTYFLEKYSMAQVKKGRKKIQTVQTEEFFIRQLNRKLGNLLIPDITPQILEDYMDSRYENGVSTITVHHELNLLRHAFQLAVAKWEFIKKTPFAKIKLPKGDKKRVRYLSTEEVGKLFETLDKMGWLRSVVIVARETGLRLSNVCNLTWNQVNLFKRYIEIEKTKNGKPVWIPLSDLVHAELMKLNKVRDLQFDRVFLVDGNTIHRNRVGLAFRRLMKKAGIENFRFHDLRHDFCSRLIQAGEELSVVSELAGHSSIITTQRYAHLSPELKRKAISSLNGFKLASNK
jgi:integrase